MFNRGLYNPNSAFPGKFDKAKVIERPQFSGGRSGQIWCGTSLRGLAASPSARGRSAAMVPWPIGLKLRRTVTPMGT